MLALIKALNLRESRTLFCIGIGAVLLSFVVAIPPVWNTFMLPWRAEVAASILLAVALIVALKRNSAETFNSVISRREFLGIVCPLLAFIVWSGVSALWAGSKPSVLHHTTVWIEYLVFYLFLRHILEKRGSYRKIILTVTACLGFLGVLAIFAYATFTIFQKGPALGFVYAKYGEQVNTIFPLALAGVLSLKGRKFAAGAALLVLLWLLVFCSLSRANLGLFVLSAAAIWLLLLTVKRFRRFRRKTAALTALFILAPLPFSALAWMNTDSGTPTSKRIASETERGNSNEFRILMIRLSAEILRSAPITGVGADNFGFEVNRFRAAFGAQHPDYHPLAQSESEIPERAHNEYLQIAAELGIVGIAIFAWFLFGVLRMALGLWRDRKRISLHYFAAFIGLGAFLASSLVTSYSFRLMQNGFVFFFVLAVAARLSFHGRANSDRSERVAIVPSLIKPSMGFGLLACIVLLTYSGIRVASVAIATQANQTRDMTQAASLYEQAMRLDAENPEARYFYGIRLLLSSGEYARAAELIQASIAIGRAPSADYSYLASAQELAGDTAGAERTFAEAVKMYPMSPFVLTRHSVLLEKVGKKAEAEVEFQRALEIDRKQANSWRVMIAESPQAATDRAVRDPNFAPLMDLIPQAAMYAVKKEREIRHPEEKFAFGDEPF